MTNSNRISAENMPLLNEFNEFAMRGHELRVAFILPSLANRGPALIVKDIVEELLKRGVEIHIYYFDPILELDFPCRTSRISFWKGFNFNDFDIIHSNLLRPDIFVWLHRKRIKAKTITTVHNFVYDDVLNTHGRYYASLFRYLWPKLWRGMDNVVVLSKTMSDYYKTKIAPTKLSVIYNCRKPSMDVKGSWNSDIVYTKLKELRSSYRIIGVCAMLSKRKGIDQLIKVLNFQKDIYLIIVGDGPSKNELQKLARNLNVSDRCSFVGFQKSVSAYYHLFDLYAMVSRSEGFPLALLEAGGFGLPVICSGIPTFREIFTNDEVEFFELENIESLNGAILRAWDRREVLSENIRNKIAACYTVEMTADAYLRLYNELKSR